MAGALSDGRHGTESAENKAKALHHELKPCVPTLSQPGAKYDDQFAK
jgi:hypothetical protein